ncbi:serpin B10-like isoform X3 [Hemicordylus capensis]|uniref:serpin B10-like isoform X3 n=1 Tax=Hemicordylus capensis TaxID=884348 RepID=UPI0023025C8D|nr:serpin B10-like isoform X3 [Hemicordylus capensis]
MDSISVANGNFTLDFFKKLNQSFPGKNLFFSSWSISTSLSMVYLGARNNTATEMAKVLHFSGRKETESSPSSQELDLGKGEELHRLFQELISEINKTRSTYLLKTANRLYGEQTFQFFSEYLQLAKKYYHAEPQMVDFLTAAEQVRNQINSWVESETGNKIKDLLPKDAVDDKTALVLVNAIYFKGKWETKFERENTAEKPFRMSKTISKPVQMMFLKSKCPAFYIDTLRVTILELPYVNKELSMFILLPDDITDDSTGLELLEKELTYERLSIWTSPEMMENMEVEVHLPKMKLEESYDLGSTLSSMGMMDAFSESRANFTGMSKKNNLFLSKVFHKSFVEVNEEGTEAAAATATVVVVRSSQKPLTFEVDHPFLFFIRYNKTKSILFFGRFCSP